jgi:hypothetical protein
MEHMEIQINNIKKDGKFIIMVKSQKIRKLKRWNFFSRKNTENILIKKIVKNVLLRTFFAYQGYDRGCVVQ